MAASADRKRAALSRASCGNANSRADWHRTGHGGDRRGASDVAVRAAVSDRGYVWASARPLDVVASDRGACRRYRRTGGRARAGRGL